MATYRPLNATSPPDDQDRPRSVVSPPPDSARVRQLAGADELIAAGFEPLEELTGTISIGQQWPEAHRRSLPETRPENLEIGEDVVWFVRSPWPSLTAAEAIDLVWSQLPRDDDESGWPAKAREVLSWPEALAQDVFDRGPAADR